MVVAHSQLVTAVVVATVMDLLMVILAVMVIVTVVIMVDHSLGNPNLNGNGKIRSGSLYGPSKNGIGYRKGHGEAGSVYGQPKSNDN